MAISLSHHFLSPKPSSNLRPRSSLRVAIAAGGTGGHIFPAIAIAEELKLAVPSADILFLGRPHSMESSAVSSAGFAFSPVPAAPLRRPKLSPQNLTLPFGILVSLLRSRSVLAEFRPDLVLGTGGYVSFPACLAAAIFGGSPAVFIQEQNSVPGIANLALSRFAQAVFVAFDSAVESFPAGSNCVVVGNPVRVVSSEAVSKAEAVERFFPEMETAEAAETEKEVVVVLGGSLGAGAVNFALLNCYKEMLYENERMLLIWQTGAKGFEEMKSLVDPHPRLHLAPFIHSMELAYRAGDLVISRAGAMTCSEILAHGKPSILIPSPYVAEGHQFKNASLMADLADTMVISEDELNSTTLKLAVKELLGDKEKLAAMSKKALKAAKPNAAAEIVQHILQMVSVSSPNKQR